MLEKLLVNLLARDTYMTTPTEQTAPNQEKKSTDTPDPKVKKRNDGFRQWIAESKAYRKKLITNWSTSIDYRRGKPFASQSDQDQVAVNLDWSLTKSKQASLFSQIPEVRLNHSPETLPKNSPWSAKFERRLNDTLREAGIEATMDECLPDCINAAGIAIALVSYDSITEDREVPVMDVSQFPPEIQTQILQTGQLNGEPIAMETIPHTIDHRYVIERISPADFLWPKNFTQSNFDKAPVLGRTGRITWANALQKFNKLKEEDKSAVLGDERTSFDRLTNDIDKDKDKSDEVVEFDELFFYEYQYNPDSKSYSTIHHLVFVNGKDDPVIDEPWKGQHVEEDGTIVGSTKSPLRILTLTYLTDEAIPPSDSAIGRPQVDEINKARTQMIRQRERSLPVRWFDVNRVDPAIQQTLMRGSWQAMIPIQGDGTRIIGEVARAQMHQENFLFDKIAKADLLEEFGAQQSVAQAEEAEGDPNQNKASFNTVAGRERAKVASFFVGIAEVLGGLMCLYEDPASFGEGFSPAASRTLKYSILADSTVLLDAGQKLSRINQFINLYAKSGFVNLEPVLQEVAILTGLDPATVIKAPDPKAPVEPNISLRLTGVEDMLNPLALAFLIHSGQAPDGALIEQAKALIQQAVTPPQGAVGQPPGLGGQMGPGGLPLEGAPLPSPTPAPPPGTPLPSPPKPKIGEANEAMSAMPQINKRSEGGGIQ